MTAGRSRARRPRPTTAPRRSTCSSRARARTIPRARRSRFAWDFDNNGTTDSTAANPTHTYTNPGSYTATLRVTDAGGLTAVDNVQVVAGNTRPVVTIEIPENGQFAAFGDKVPYKISVTDAQDGSTGSGISCSDVTLNVSLGHDLHAHTLSTHTGCEGTVDTLLTSGHGDTANVFTVLEADLHRQGRDRERPAHRSRGGDPAAEAQAGRVLQLDRSRGERHRRR